MTGRKERDREKRWRKRNMKVKVRGKDRWQKSKGIMEGMGRKGKES